MLNEALMLAALAAVIATLAWRRRARNRRAEAEKTRADERACSNHGGVVRVYGADPAQAWSFVGKGGSGGTFTASAAPDATRYLVGRGKVDAAARQDEDDRARRRSSDDGDVAAGMIAAAFEAVTWASDSASDSAPSSSSDSGGSSSSSDSDFAGGGGSFGGGGASGEW